MHGFEAIPAILARYGVPVVFGMIAETNGPWLADGERRGSIRFVRTRHESTAVLAAAGFARSTGTVGVATVTRGPGFANALNALVATVEDRIPLVMIVAHSSTTVPATQNLAQQQIAELVGAAYYLVSTADELEGALSRAIGQAGRIGQPQVVAMEDAALTQTTNSPSRELVRETAAAPRKYSGDLSAAVEILSAAQRPLVIAGRGVVLAGCEAEVLRLGERLGARIGTTLRSLAMFHEHPLNVGLVGGWAGAAARPYFAAVDCVLALGASLNRYTLDQGQLFPAARIIHCVDAVPSSTLRAADITLLGDVTETVAQLTHELERRHRAPVTFSGPTWEAIRRSVLERKLDTDPARGLDVREVVLAVDALLPDDRIVVTDSGRALVPIPALIGARDARSWHHGRGYGSIGLGLGLAIGAAIAHPKRRVVLFVGDGAFLQSSMDLDATRLAGLVNLLIVVLDDERYGMETGRLRALNLPLDVISQSSPAIVALATAYGLQARTINSLTMLPDAIVHAPSRPVLLHIPIDPETDQATAVGRGGGII